jgi:hypothetical protein
MEKNNPASSPKNSFKADSGTSTKPQTEQIMRLSTKKRAFWEKLPAPAKKIKNI